MMDQLMIGYGVTNTSASTAQTSYNTSPVNSTNINQPKKELTLAEKQQLANKLEKENGTTSTSSTTSLSSIKSSKSMTDSFMNKNLVDLTTNSQKISNASNKSNNYDFAEFDTVLSSSSNASVQQQQNSSVSFNSSNKPAQFGANTMNSFNGFNQFNINSNSMSQMSRSSSSQQGFFGNLALPAPPMANTTTTTPMNKNSMIPNIAPPPMKQLQPMINLSTAANSLNGSSNTSKKSALDDLNDLFG